MPKTQALAWVDLETTGLEPGLDQILEISMIITDMDLNIISGQTEVIQLTQGGADRLRGNPNVLKMHQGNGLLKEAATAGQTTEAVEDMFLSLIKETTTFGEGDFMLAGSGVASFDLGMMRVHMPRLARMFAYYTFDIGVMRRVSGILYGGPLVNPSSASYGDEKLHRAEADIKAHLAEAKLYRNWFQHIRGNGVY